MSVQLALLVAVVVLLVLGLRPGLGAGADFEVRYRPRGRVVVRGRIPAVRVGAIREFFDRDLQPDGPVVVRGVRSAGRGLRLQVHGALTPGQRQRVRNFIREVIR